MDNNELLEQLKLGDKSAGDKLVENNMGLVYSIVSRFSNRNYESEDLAQIGAIGLIKAVQKFDFSYGVKFSTYAVPMIMGEIKRFLRDDGAIKVSRALKETAVKAKRAEEQLIKELDRKPTIKEIADKIGANEGDVVEALESAIQPESLQAAINAENGTTLMEMIAAEEVEEKIIDRVYLKEALSRLSEREYKIIIMRYFKNKTQSEVANEFGISQVQISRIEKKVLERLRKEACAI